MFRYTIHEPQKEAQSLCNEGLQNENILCLDNEGLQKLAKAILKQIIDDADTEAICSDDAEFWCDVFGINPIVFRRHFRRHIRRELKELQERREHDKRKKKEKV